MGVPILWRVAYHDNVRISVKSRFAHAHPHITGGYHARALLERDAKFAAQVANDNGVRMCTARHRVHAAVIVLAANIPRGAFELQILLGRQARLWLRGHGLILELLDYWIDD